MAKKKTHEIVRRPGKGSVKAAKESWLKFDAKTKSILAIIGIIILALLIAYGNRILGGDDSSLVAKVNGQKITVTELDDQYSKLVSADYRQVITKEYFLNQTMIPELLLVQEADRKGIKASKSEAEEFITAFLEQSQMTKDELEKQLAEQGMDYAQFVEFYSKRLKIIKLLNTTLGIPEITEEEIKEFYDENKESFVFGNQTTGLEDMSEQIQSYLANQKQQQEIAEYIEDLRKTSKIELFPENINEAAAPGSSFMDTGGEVCYEDGKPIIRMFSSTGCPHCRWIKNTFDSVAKEYVENGLIAAYHWDVDTGDNTLTDGTEKSMSAGEIEILNAYNHGGGVPFYIFGCRYLRLGNAYEAQNDLVSEENEFRAVIDSLLAEGNGGANETGEETI